MHTLDLPITETLARDPCVRLVYRFGSTVHGEPGQDSDVDIAILTRPPLTFREENAMRADLQTLDARIDPVFLNDASIALRHEVVTTGRCLLAREQDEQAEFEIRVLAEQQDFEPMRRVQQEYLRLRVEERRGLAPHRHS